MTTTRREWMKVAAVAGGALSASPALVGCERVISRVTEEFGQTIPERVSVAGGPEIDPSFHLLSLLRTFAASRVRSVQALASPVETSELRATPTFGAEQ